MKLQQPKGTKDLNPEDKILMDKVVKTLSEVFELYGFNPIDFPVLERYETLGAKFAAGEGSDTIKEIFKLKDQGKRDLGLRFDLTVPFSRYIGMNPSIKMPFKKYVSGKVFRDGPIKLGRMREFFQIDPDIVGVKSVVADAEIISLVMMAFEKLGLEVRGEYNTRKLIDSILDLADVPSKDRFSVIISIDKLKKIGEDGVRKELKGKLKNNNINIIMEFMKEETYQKKIKNLKNSLKDKDGIKEIEELNSYLSEMNVNNIDFNVSLARGLAYYTGPVYEFFLKKSNISSSVAGGGRYDDMIGNFLESKREFPATGVSFGVSVIIEALKESNTEIRKSVADIFIIPIQTLKESMKIAQQLRNKGIKTEVDLLGRGISKNLQYADSLGIPFVLFIGPDELKKNKVKLRNMKSGEEEILSVKELVSMEKL